MIHQLIFAHPKPGMSEQDFQDYWVNLHAVRYAGKIPQIRQYTVDTRVPFGPEPDDPLWSGIAEIWVDNDEDQLASLQSKEYIEGARPDEPNWAAFWRTLVLDTEPHVLLEGQEYTVDEPDTIKLVVLAKRRSGTDLSYFRKRSLESFGQKTAAVPGLRRYLQCHARDGMYAVSEAPLDVAHLLTFDGPEALTDAARTSEYTAAMQDLRTFTEHRYLHTMAVREHWIIPPGTR